VFLGPTVTKEFSWKKNSKNRGKKPFRKWCFYRYSVWPFCLFHGGFPRNEPRGGTFWLKQGLGISFAKAGLLRSFTDFRFSIISIETAEAWKCRTRLAARS